MLFKHFDVDNQGFISILGLKHAFAQTGKVLTDEDEDKVLGDKNIYSDN